MHLYIHIPFCFAKCDYCDFFSVPCGGTPIPDSYISAVIGEAAYKARRHQVERWDTIYIGGGTPSLLSAAQIRTLLSGIASCVADKTSDETTIEMNPESLTEEKLSAAQDSGVTRLSLGIQSLAPEALSSVHRHCTPEKALCALETVRRVWRGQVNTDAIAGLPVPAGGGSREQQFLSTIERVLSYHPNHFSLYTLTVEEGTPLYRRNKTSNECNGDEADRLWLLGRQMLEKNGLKQYEVSNFASPGCESRHNYAYWRQEDYLGCGPGACGTVYCFSGANGIRSTNTTDIADYTSFWEDILNRNVGDSEIERRLNGSTVQEREQLPLRTEEFEFLMMGLRTLEGVGAAEYRRRFSSVAPWHGNLQERFQSCGETYRRFLSKEYLRVYKNRLGGDAFSLTAQGILFLNTLLCAFA